MSWIWDWLTSVLNYLGLHSKTGKLVFLGLDYAGKTCLLQRLKDGRMAQHSPTYYPTVDAIVFMVDCADLSRIEESRVELESLLRDEQVADTPILILGNKIDKSTALNEDQLKWHLQVQNMCTGKDLISRNELSSRPLEVFMCSVLREQGYGEGFRWLAQYLD